MAWHTLSAQFPTDVIKAFYNLRGDSNFAVIMKWFRSGLAEEDKNNRGQQQVVLLHQGQGRAQALEAVINVNDTAEENVRKLQTPQ